MVTDFPISRLTLDLHQGKAINIDVLPTDIGGQILALLSKSLYTDPLHSVREYVQNAVDGSATEIVIKYTGKSIVIFDNGKGMNFTELKDARRIGVSEKTSRTAIGFRGIGIYAGYNVCERLTVTATSEGEPWRYIMELQFEAMRRRLEQEERVSGRSTIPLSELLRLYTRFWAEAERPEMHYTVVQLEGIDDSNAQALENEQSLKSYILRNLPLGFSDDFPHVDTIRDRMDSDLQYRPPRVFLEYRASPRQELRRPAIPNLQAPEIAFIYHGSRKDPIAWYWASLYQGRSRIPVEHSDFTGFVYKVKGFTVGDNRRFKESFRSGSSTLYSWYTGEVFVLDPQVIPNTERGDFEANVAKNHLEEEVKKVLVGLDKRALGFQEESRAQQKIDQAAKDLTKLELQIGSGTYDDYAVYARLDDLIKKDLKPHRSKARDKDVLDQLVQRAEELKRRARRSGGSAESQSSHERREPRQEQSTQQATDGPSPEPPAPEPERSLMQVFEDSGWGLDGDCARAVQILDASVANKLGGRSSDIYRDLVRDIEAKIVWRSFGR